MAMDSIDKIVTSYFATVTRFDFEYKGRAYTARPLRVSPLLLRGFTCPAMCGGCCYNVTLDYLPSEKRPRGPLVMEREIEFDGRSVPIWSDIENHGSAKHCKNLTTDGRCGIYELRPSPVTSSLFVSCSARTGRTSVNSFTAAVGAWNVSMVDVARCAR